MRILVVEDQAKVASFIKKGLEEESYSVDLVHDGESALQYATGFAYDLILLDVMLPKKDGFQVCGDMRQNGVTTPILMLTARDMVDDKVKGFESGADDYLTKPFAFAELLARIRALLRRGTGQSASVLQVDDLSLDLLKHSAARGGTSIDLTNKEYALLEYMMRNTGLVLTRTMIAEHVWDLNFDSETNVIDVYMNHLRKKVDGSASSKLIHTIRGRGYVLKSKNDS